jgi:photosystem II stability/assembly factor-like uncharacterized protein
MRSGTARLVVLALLAVLGLTSAPAYAAQGLHWDNVSPPTDARLRGLAAVSDRVAWVSGTEGTVMRTADGGQHWKDVSPGGTTGDLEFRDIEAWDSRNAVVLSIGEGGDSRIYRTADGGRTWKLGFRNASKNAFYDCISFWDRRHGLAMSDPVHGKFRILVTKDGGRSWAKRPAAGMPSADGEFGFAASGTCLVTAGKQDAWIAGGGTAARVYHSTDRGLTWTVASTPIRHGDAAGIFSLAVRDQQHLVAVGGDFEKPRAAADTSAYTNDGGATWSPGGKLGGYRSGAAFLPDDTGQEIVAVGPTGTDVTRDGGVSWRQVDRRSLDSIECAGTCWGSGDLGRVARLEVAPG